MSPVHDIYLEFVRHDKLGLSFANSVFHGRRHQFVAQESHPNYIIQFLQGCRNLCSGRLIILDVCLFDPGRESLVCSGCQDVDSRGDIKVPYTIVQKQVDEMSLKSQNKILASYYHVEMFCSQDSPKAPTEPVQTSCTSQRVLQLLV